MVTEEQSNVLPRRGLDHFPQCHVTPRKRATAKVSRPLWQGANAVNRGEDLAAEDADQPEELEERVRLITCTWDDAHAMTCMCPPGRRPASD